MNCAYIFASYIYYSYKSEKNSAALELLLIFSLPFSRVRFSSCFGKSCWFDYTLGVDSLPYLEHSPSCTNSMPCSVKSLVCHLCCSFSIPAMTKTASVFSLTKTNTISRPKPSSGPFQTWEAVNPLFSQVEPFLLWTTVPKKKTKQVQTKLQEFELHQMAYDSR